MSLLRLRCSLSLPPISSSSSSLHQNIKPKQTNLRVSVPVPARDRIIDFGKHKGKMLGSLPSKYLRWVSKNLRARDFQQWAELADEVLTDPVYKDRMEWEHAERILSGNNPNTLRSSNNSAVSSLLEISERFGWDNEDKAGWARVDFGLLGTSKGGRIPRRSKESRERISDGDEELVSRKREERRERRRRLKAQMQVLGEKEVGFGRKKTTSVSGNPFPGRGALLDKIRRGGTGTAD